MQWTEGEKWTHFILLEPPGMQGVTPTLMSLYLYLYCFVFQIWPWDCNLLFDEAANVLHLGCIMFLFLSNFLGSQALHVLSFASLKGPKAQPFCPHEAPAQGWDPEHLTSYLLAGVQAPSLS